MSIRVSAVFQGSLKSSTEYLTLRPSLAASSCMIEDRGIWFLCMTRGRYRPEERRSRIGCAQCFPVAKLFCGAVGLCQGNSDEGAARPIPVFFRRLLEVN